MSAQRLRHTRSVTLDELRDTERNVIVSKSLGTV